MKKMALCCAIVLAGCAYHQPPDIEAGGNIELRNALGEVRWCQSPQVTSASLIGGVAGGGLGALLGAQGRPAASRACVNRMRARGYAPLGEAPMPLDELRAMRAREAAEAEADMARRNAER